MFYTNKKIIILGLIMSLAACSMSGCSAKPASEQACYADSFKAEYEFFGVVDKKEDDSIRVRTCQGAYPYVTYINIDKKSKKYEIGDNVYVKMKDIESSFEDRYDDTYGYYRDIYYEPKGRTKVIKCENDGCFKAWVSLRCGGYLFDEDGGYLKNPKEDIIGHGGGYVFFSIEEGGAECISADNRKLDIIDMEHINDVTNKLYNVHYDPKTMKLLYLEEIGYFDDYDGIVHTNKADLFGHKIEPLDIHYYDTPKAPVYYTGVI